MDFALALPPRRPKLRGDCVVTEGLFSFGMRGEWNPGVAAIVGDLGPPCQRCTGPDGMCEVT